MKMSHLTALLLCGCAIATTASGQSGTAQELLEAARKTAVLDGDCPAAIKQYQSVVTRFEKTDRAAAARGLVGIAECYDKSGNSQEAQRTYARVIKEFSDQASAVAEARRHVVQPGGAGAGAGRDDAPFAALDMSFFDKSDLLGLFLSPDGQRIALRRNNGTELSLRTRSTGAERRVLTSGGTITSVSWAPDSSAVAFLEIDLAARTTTLRIAPAATAVARGVMTWPGEGLYEDTLLWSPTSDRVAFTTESIRDRDGACPEGQRVVPCRWDVRVAPVSAGPATLLGSTWKDAFRSETYFAWSPDGRRLAFEQQGGTGGEGLHIIDVTTRRGTVHATTGTNVGLLAWTATNELLLSQSGEYVFIAAATGEPRKASWSKGDELVAIGPGAEWFIVHRASTRKLIKKAVSDGSEQTITTGAGQETNARLSPDGQLLAFASNRDGTWALYVAHLDQLPVDRPLRLAALRAAPTNRATALAGGWGADGTFVTSLAATESHLYRMPVASARPEPTGSTQITVNSPLNLHPAISPDGRRVAFVAMPNNRPWITVMDADGRNERPLLERDVLATAWRSAKELLIKDGRSLVTVDVESGALTPLPGSPAFDTPRGGTNWAYVPERQEVIYVTVGALSSQAGGTARFFAHSLVAGETRELATRERVLPAGQMLAVAPGGERLAFVSGGAITIMTIATAGDASTDRTLGAGPPVRPAMSWAPDGRQLVACLPAGRCEIVDAVTGAARPLLSNQAVADRRQTEAAWSPNGTFVVVNGSGVQMDWRGFLGVTAAAVAKK